MALSPPQSTVWFYMFPDCGGAAVSANTVLKQAERTDSDYVMVAHDPRFVDLFSAAEGLAATGAYSIIHTESLPSEGASARKGLALLRRTGNPAAPAPARMSATSARRLMRCLKAAEGDRYAAAIRKSFPQGIVVTGKAGAERKVSAEIQRLYDVENDRFPNRQSRP